MANYNQAILIGNLTAEPNLNYTQSGTPVANFTVAVNSKFGEREETLFMSCVVFGKLADVVVKYCPKGKNVLVTGRLVLESWTTAEEQKRSQIKLYVSQLQLLGSASKEDNYGVAASYSSDINEESQENEDF